MSSDLYTEIDVIRSIYEAETQTFGDFLVSPIFAARLLERNIEGNRNVRDYEVERYARSMRDGNWVNNGHPVCFSKSGRLIDGQHRLRAIMRAGTPVRLDIRVGVDDKAMPTIDAGIKRTGADQLRIAGCAVNTISDLVWASVCNRWFVFGKGKLHLSKQRNNPDLNVGTPFSLIAVSREIRTLFTEEFLERAGEYGKRTGVSTKSGPLKIFAGQGLAVFIFLAIHAMARENESSLRFASEFLGFLENGHSDHPGIANLRCMPLLRDRLIRIAVIGKTRSPMKEGENNVIGIVMKVWGRARNGKDLSVVTVPHKKERIYGWSIPPHIYSFRSELPGTPAANRVP